jgi:predicted RNA-binding Zn-ribbon protein involved in translation (DUF1610 family)
MSPHSHEQQSVKEQFAGCKRRQLRATILALFLVLFIALVYKRPDLFGDYLKASLFAGECLAVAAYIGFTAANWRCPSCGGYLGVDFLIARCRRCGERLR